MGNFLANVARRAAGIAPQLHGVHTAIIRPVIPLLWRTEPAAGRFRNEAAEQSWVGPGEEVFDHCDHLSTIAPKVLTKIPNAAPAQGPLTKHEQVHASAMTVPAPAWLPVETADTAPQDKSLAAATSANRGPDAEASPPIASRSADDGNTPMAAVVEIHLPLSQRKGAESYQSPEVAVVKERPETPRPQFAAERTLTHVAPYKAPAASEEAESERSRVAPKLPAMPTPVMQLLPQERREAPQERAVASSSREPPQVVVKIGKVEVRANQTQGVVRVSRPAGNSGFADMTLRRAHLDRHYR
jgi:hypothetical protein